LPILVTIIDPIFAPVHAMVDELKAFALKRMEWMDDAYKSLRTFATRYV